MIKTISRTHDTILVVDDTTVKTARADHPKWADINRVFDSIGYEGNQFTGPTEELLDLMDMRTAVENYTVGLLSVNSLGVTYNGRLLHTIDAERVMSFMRDKLSYKPIANYIARKMKNPSARAISEMYNFLEHKGMPLTPKGTFIAYKGVTSDFWSVNGNKNTVVLKGETDDRGRILNTIGSTIEVERSSVDDNFQEGCSFGLHAGSIAYAKGWGSRVLLVEIDPADVVSVPEDCNCQKLRCCKYTIVAEYTGPMPDTLTTEFDDSNELDVCHTCGSPNGECNCDQHPLAVNEQEDGCCRDCWCHTEDLDAARNPSADETPDESWIREKAKVETVVTAGGEPTTHDLLGCTGEIFVKVTSIISEQTGVPQKDIEPFTRMNDVLLNLDSLDSVELTMYFEEEFDIEIRDEDAEKMGSFTVMDIVKYIEDRVERSRPRTVTPDSKSRGFLEGTADRQSSHIAKWLPGDDDGADSENHAQYIRGYIAGYNLK